MTISIMQFVGRGFTRIGQLSKLLRWPAADRCKRCDAWETVEIGERCGAAARAGGPSRSGGSASG
jgi:hypothetical protein